MYGSYLQDYLNKTQVQQTVAPQVKVPSNTPAINNSGKKDYLAVTETIDNSNKVKPEKGQGHLIHDTLKDKIKYFGFDRKYDAKALIDGYSGRAKDHQLGRLNDVGLVAGGLAIAGFIAASKQTAKAKIMEFVGLASFLLAMKVWPKVAIETPAKLVHGFNVNKQYIDDQGRKKSVFQDSQYIPWDLYTGERPDENISLIGDKMGIKKDIPNRDEVIKDQMRKIATQNNALWMLSAGAATPILGALGACAAEGAIDDGLEIVRNNKANTKIRKMSDALKSTYDIRKVNTKAVDKISVLLNGKQGTAVGETFINSLTDVMSGEIRDAKLLDGVKSDLTQILKPENPVFNAESRERIFEGLSSKLEKLNLIDKNSNKLKVSDILPKMNEVEERLIEAFGTETISVTSESKAKQVSDVIETLMYDKLYNVLPKEELEKVTGTVRKVTVEGLKSSAATLTAENSATISSYLKEVLKFQETHKGLDECMKVKIGECEDSVLAKNWKRVERTLTKALGISDKELKAARLGRINSEELFAKKLEELAAKGNEENYKKALDKIVREMNNLDIRLHGNLQGTSVMQDLFGAVDKNYEATKQGIERVSIESNGALKKSKFIESLLEERFTGAGSHKNTFVSGAKERINSVKSTYNRIINAFDIFKRAGNVKKTDREAVDVAKKVKEIVLNAHSKDFSEKFFTDNNLSFYREIYKFMCNEKVSDETKEVLDGLPDSVKNSLKEYKKKLNYIVGNDASKIKTKHTIPIEDGYVYKRADATASKIFNLIGKSPSEFLKDAAQKQYNSNKWLRTFGAIGASVLALTTAAQFAFGGKDDAIKEVKL